MIAFYLLAPVMVLAALGILVVRKAVHAALLLAVVMISLAVLYAVLEAPFLFAVQIIVYTGAIMMLFLFVVMLVGVDASDSVVETIRGQRGLAVIAGLGLVCVLAVGVAQISLGAVVGLTEANAAGNVQGLADVLFSRYVVAFEVTAALLISAALGAMVLAHEEPLTRKPGQAERARGRMTDYRATGRHPGPLPTPGVYARHNAVDTPALLPDGSPAPRSISRVLAARGTVRTAPSADLRDVSSAVHGVPGGASSPGRTSSGHNTENPERWTGHDGYGTAHDGLEGTAHEGTEHTGEDGTDPDARGTDEEGRR